MAVVTGAGSGIGRGVALALAARGAASRRSTSTGPRQGDGRRSSPRRAGARSRFSAIRAKAIEIDRAVDGGRPRARPARDHGQQCRHPRRLLQRRRDGRGPLAPRDRHRPHRRLPRLQARARGDAAARPRAHRQHGLGGRPERHGRRRGVRRGQARRGRAHAPDGGGVFLARRDDQRRVPRAHPDQPPPALAGDPRTRTSQT